MLFPGFYDADAVLAVWIQVRGVLLLVHGADLEGFGYFLSSKVAITDAHVLLFLLLNSAKLTIALACALVRDAELALSDLFNDVELGVKTITFGHGVWHYHF